MTGQRAPTPAESADHPLRAALASGDRLLARSAPALQHLLLARDRALLSDAIVAQVSGLLSDIARQLLEAGRPSGGTATPVPPSRRDALSERLLDNDALRSHCQALALEWQLALRLESELSLDPVLSPLLQSVVGDADPDLAATAMAALAAQARFAQGQRRMQLPIAELPAELFHAALLAARSLVTAADAEVASRAEAVLRSNYDEGTGRLALMARMLALPSYPFERALAIEDAGAALWLSALAARSGEARDRTACAAADPSLGRMLLTLRAAGVSAAEAERQALRIAPDADLPRGLEGIGTREAAQWLADARKGRAQ